MSHLHLEKEKIKKWKKLHSRRGRPYFYAVEQNAPMKRSWLKRRQGAFAEWKDYYCFLKGHFIYMFGSQKKKTRALETLFIFKAKAEPNEELDNGSSIFPFTVHFIVHLRPKWKSRKYVRVHERKQKAVSDAEEFEDAAETKLTTFISSITLSASSERLRKEWVSLINFLAVRQHVGTSKLEELAKKVKIPGVSAEELELGNVLARRKHAKWKELFKKKPMLMDLKQPVDKEGVIKKIGGRSSLWQSRFFVLKGHFLYYFKRDMPSARMAGVIFLRNAKIRRVVYSGLDMVLRIDSLFPRRWPTSDNDTPTFYLAFESSLHLESWWDMLQAHADSVHAGRSKRPAILEKLKEVQYARLYGSGQSKQLTGSWLVKPPTNATEKLAEVEQPGWRERHKKDEILGERKRLGKLERADITVEVRDKAKELKVKAEGEVRAMPALQPVVDPNSLAREGIDEEEEEEFLEELLGKTRRNFADWKDAKKKTRLKVGDKLQLG